jgi:hypothetical protein
MSPTQPREAKRYENLLVIVLFLAFGFVFFDRQAVPFLFPFISKEIGLTNTQLGSSPGYRNRLLLTIYGDHPR